MLESECSSPTKAERIGFYGKQNKLNGAHKMDVQIPYRVHPQVSKKSDIWTIPGRSQGNHTESLPIQRHRDYRRPYDAGSRSLVVKYTTKVQCFGNHGVPQRKECTDDLRQTRKPEVQVWEQAFLGRRILREYSRPQ